MNTNLFNHLEYRDFLRLWISQLPHRGRGELAKIARSLEINTTLLSQIMSGTREFTMEQAIGLGHYLGLNKIELEYFLTLIQLSRAGTSILKKHLLEKIEEIRTSAKKLSTRINHDRTLTETEKSIFYSSWLYSSIHLYTSLESNGFTLDEIASHFKLTRAKVNEILNFLKDTQLCKEINGRFTMGTQSTFVPQGSPHLVRHHLNWRIKAMERSESLLENDLMYTAQISISKNDLERIRELGINFIKMVNEIAKPSMPEELVNINLDLFQIK